MLTNHPILASEIGLKVSPDWMTEDDECGHEREAVTGRVAQCLNVSKV